MKPLNGWQRLWVIAAVILLPVVARTLLRTMPTAAEYRETWKHFADAEAPTARRKTPSDIAACREDRALMGGNAAEALKACHEQPETTPQDRKRYDEVIAKGEAAVRDDLPWDQATHIGMIMLVWAVLSALLYGVGCLVAWVRRGSSKACMTPRESVASAPEHLPKSGDQKARCTTRIVPTVANAQRSKSLISFKWMRYQGANSI